MDSLLPLRFDALLGDAIRYFWGERASGEGTQEGERSKVIAGKNLDGFLAVVEAVCEHSGIPSTSVFMRGRRDMYLPGYFRPTKNWDVVIVHRHRLIAVLEFKSQAGSFGNNANNRAEEAVGNGVDLWHAHEHGAYSPENHTAPIADSDPRPPFLGYLMILEDCRASRKPVRMTSPHYRVLPGFAGSSYADRYRILCERLMEKNLYQAAALALSPREAGARVGAHVALSEATSVRRFFVELAARLAAAAQR